MTSLRRDSSSEVSRIDTKRREEDPNPYKISSKKEKRVALILNHHGYNSFHVWPECQDDPEAWADLKFETLPTRDGTKADSDRLKMVLVDKKFNFGTI